MSTSLNKKKASTKTKENVSQALEKLYETVRMLRHPEKGCPWDLEQDHTSLRRYLIEEAYEACEAIGSGDDTEICDELGDVLLQVYLHGQIASERQAFDLASIANNLNEKLIRRHPHVFKPGEAGVQTSEDVIESWDKIKQKENEAKNKSVDGYFAQKKVHKISPATFQSYKIGSYSARISFDWDSPQEVFQHFMSEIQEMKEELELCTDQSKSSNRDRLKEEVGDCLFTLIQLCRHLEFDPETTLLEANAKFLKRFAMAESLGGEEGIDMTQASRQQQEKLWNKAKETIKENQ